MNARSLPSRERVGLLGELGCTRSGTAGATPGWGEGGSRGVCPRGDPELGLGMGGWCARQEGARWGMNTRSNIGRGAERG